LGLGRIRYPTKKWASLHSLFLWRSLPSFLSLFLWRSLPSFLSLFLFVFSSSLAFTTKTGRTRFCGGGVQSGSHVICYLNALFLSSRFLKQPPKRGGRGKGKRRGADEKKSRRRRKRGQKRMKGETQRWKEIFLQCKTTAFTGCSRAKAEKKATRTTKGSAGGLTAVPSTRPRLDSTTVTLVLESYCFAAKTIHLATLPLSTVCLFGSL
jgi:hypothetical protein